MPLMPAVLPRALTLLLVALLMFITLPVLPLLPAWLLLLL